MVGTLTSSRERLMAVLAAGAAQSDPTQAAEAQVAFDCWMQEQEENFQPDDIAACRDRFEAAMARSEEHTSELQSLMRISYAVFCLKKKTTTKSSKATTHSTSTPPNIAKVTHVAIITYHT